MGKFAQMIIILTFSVIPMPSALPGLAWLGLAWFDLVWLGGARLDADASCLREIHLAPEPPFQAPPRHIPGPGGTKLCSPAPISRANCLIINNGRCQVNFTKRCMRVHSGYACVADVLSSCMCLHHTVAYCMAVTDVVGGSKQTSFRKVSYPFARIEGVACHDCVCNRSANRDFGWHQTNTSL